MSLVRHYECMNGIRFPTRGYIFKQIRSQWNRLSRSDFYIFLSSCVIVKKKNEKIYMFIHKPNSCRNSQPLHNTVQPVLSSQSRDENTGRRFNADFTSCVRKTRGDRLFVTYIFREDSE